MRKWMNLIEGISDPRHSPREAFLWAVELWASEMFNNDYESNKPEIETELFKFEELAAQYRTVEHRMLFRGTGGISREQLEAIQKGATGHIDMTETHLSSWTTNPEIAEGFIERYYRHFEGDCAFVANYQASDLDVFLSVPDLWWKMTPAEKKQFDGISIAAREQEIIVRHPPQLPLKAHNIYLIGDAPEEEEEDLYNPTDDDEDW